MSAVCAPTAVLVVEDESLVRMFAVDVLEDEGYEVIEAGNAAEALLRLSERPDIAIVFTDINMPGAMDGIGLARAIKQTRPDVHIILTSGNVTPQHDTLPSRSPFVTKPYTASQLISLLQKALN